MSTYLVPEVMTSFPGVENKKVMGCSGSTVERMVMPPIRLSEDEKKELRFYLNLLGEYTEDEAKDIEDELEKGAVGMYVFAYFDCIVAGKWSQIQSDPLKVLARLLRWRAIGGMLSPRNVSYLMSEEPSLVSYLVRIAMDDLKQGKLSDAEIERIVDLSKESDSFGRCVRKHLPSVRGASTQLIEKVKSLSKRLPESRIRDFNKDRENQRAGFLS